MNNSNDFVECVIKIEFVGWTLDISSIKNRPLMMNTSDEKKTGVIIQKPRIVFECKNCKCHAFEH